MSLSNDDVLAILALLDASRFDELRVETADFKLHLRRSAGPHRNPRRRPAATAAVAAPPANMPDPQRTAPPKQDGVEVKAPLLGTYYGAPQPGAPPFVTVGARVEENTVVAIIEVMKLMNSVCAGTRGVVMEILAQDGRLVEYGQPIVRIAPEKQ